MRCSVTFRRNEVAALEGIAAGLYGVESDGGPLRGAAMRSGAVLVASDAAMSADVDDLVTRFGVAGRQTAETVVAIEGARWALERILYTALVDAVAALGVRSRARRDAIEERSGQELEVWIAKLVDLLDKIEATAA